MSRLKDEEFSFLLTKEKKMRQISFIVTNSGIITAVVDNKHHTVAPDHANYKVLKQAVIDDDVETFNNNVDVAKVVNAYCKGVVEVKDGVVFHNGEELHNALSRRILQLMAEGYPFEPFVKFLENLMLNPSKRSVDQLYNFLEHQGLPITEDGHFLAYKRVRDDWKDFHSGQLDFSIGNVIEIPRNTVDDDPHSACSTGLHAGALKYVETFNSGGHIVIVKINPKDCVSVPHDASCTKLRTCKLEVVGEFAGELSKALYNSTGGNAAPQDEWDDWEDDDDDNSWIDDDDYDDDDDDDSWLDEIEEDAEKPNPYSW